MAASAGPGGAPWPEAAGRLWRDVSGLVRAEAGGPGGPLTAAVGRARVAGTAMALSGALGALSLVSAHQALLRTAERVLPPPRAAWALAAGYAGAAVGLTRLRRSASRAARRSSVEAAELVLTELAASDA
ncbi:hypothetical protein [Streptomyces huiliensis]|uniref:hypothetical protein n=1 Tax=Streptomyces huiliensis TaxID=2876027 RepID=UPI001CBB5BA0|nr:hypothetical protein [Streptomyces huiliensis]MBZ4323945.1 hypothetical protein [Streptomyces huiliensis]